MADENDLPSNSDESDEDYIPEGVEEALSEEESGSASENEAENNDENESGKSKKRRKSKTKKNVKKKKKLDTQLELEVEDDKTEEKKHLSEEEEKQRADLLWADFMKDTDTVPKQKQSNETESSNKTNENAKSQETMKVTKVFEFAGEEVAVEKEVPVSMLTKLDNAKRSPLMSENLSSVGSRSGPRRSGISSLVGQLGKKAKISTLEKSKLDWENFKKQENLEEEISSHNKGKDGYLEKQDFLQRADLRQFEIEKQMRSNSRRRTR